MANINLLPWRDEKRKEQTRQFISITLFSIILAAAMVFLAQVNIQRLIDHQLQRNTLLKTEIKRLDNELKEIRGLEDTKEKLLSRMDIIQSLQQKRPQIVHLFDELARTVPEGLHLKSLEQNGDNLTLTGIAESNGRVSAYMRNIDSSDWMSNPKLKVIESQRKDGRGSQFTLIVKQSAPKEPGSEDSE